MEEIIKEYLKERRNHDPELEQKFNEDQMESCISYIEKKAKEYLDSKNGAIPDEMLDYLPENLDLTNEEREERYLEELSFNY